MRHCLLLLPTLLCACVGLPNPPSPLGADDEGSTTQIDDGVESSPADGIGATSTPGNPSDDDKGEDPGEGCGDGKVGEDEECDLGPDNGAGDYCRVDCQINVCGDGYVAHSELCDDGNDIDDDECSNECGPPSCGDGQVQAPEECDEGPANSETGACLPSCTAATCGDLFIQLGVEVCDGTNIDTTCKGEGFAGGPIACADDCTAVDTSECLRCGDGVAEGDEQCDTHDFGGRTCETFAPVDTTVSGGALSCTDACTIDASDCTYCGDGLREGTEVCDGNDVGGATCVMQGPQFGGGTMACTNDCSSLSTAGCCLALAQPCSANFECCTGFCGSDGCTFSDAEPQ
ncbi:MAG: DUF4215 domain-containing protein [Myxococcota bacterium]